jgi:hypothetical protein
MATATQIVKTSLSSQSSRAIRRSAQTIHRHIEVLEEVAAQHDGILPPYKWLNENGYFTSYNVMLDHPVEFKHIKTYEQFKAEQYQAKQRATPKIVLPPKFKKLSEYNVNGAHFAPTGLDIEPGLPENEWMALGRVLATVCQSAHWWVGDFLHYGFRTYGKKATFDLAQQATGWSRGQLYGCSRLAKRFPPERRVEALSVFHHKSVASFPPDIADRLLAEAVEIGLTARQISAMGKEECGKKPSRFNRKKVSVVLWETTYNKLKERTLGRSIGWFISDIVESYLTGRPVARYDNGRKSKDFKAAILEAAKGPFDIEAVQQ